jgi:predicted AAA+ superfamily ATPase
MREVLTGLAERRLGEVVEARLAEEPVVVLNGPRTVGKSTLLSELAGRLGRAVVDCDDLATRAAVRSDPARFVESDQPRLGVLLEGDDPEQLRMETFGVSIG